MVEVELVTEVMVVDGSEIVVLEISVVKLVELEEGEIVVKVGKSAVSLELLEVELVELVEVVVVVEVLVDSKVGLNEKVDDEELVEVRVGLISELEEGVTVISVGNK